MTDTREFLPDWYERDIRSCDPAQDDPMPVIGNAAYYAWMEEVISAAVGHGRRVDWLQIGLAVTLDRAVRRDEAAVPVPTPHVCDEFCQLCEERPGL